MFVFLCVFGVFLSLIRPNLIKKKEKAIEKNDRQDDDQPDDRPAPVN